MQLNYLILDTYYPSFLKAHYAQHPEIAGLGYEEARSKLMATGFGTSDFYSTNLRSLGNVAREIVANDALLQAKWASEARVKPVVGFSTARVLASRVPYLRRFVDSMGWQETVLVEQVKAARPDVLYVQDLNLCTPEFIERIKPFVKLVVGQIASPLPNDSFLRGVDLILTACPHFVQRFRDRGIATEYFRLGFESSLLERLTSAPTSYGAVFVGGLTHLHVRGNEVIRRTAERVDLDVWGYGFEDLPPDSPILRRFHGEAWGLDMYNVFKTAKIVINRHGEVAENYAANMRLFEATGVGSLLITDEKDNLGELFEIGREIETYADADELIAKIEYFLAHEEQRARIARAGQARTLREHTFLHRMRELEQLLKPHLRRQR
jgi:spore maturation protein CgeB